MFGVTLRNQLQRTVAAVENDPLVNEGKVEIKQGSKPGGPTASDYMFRNVVAPLQHTNGDAPQSDLRIVQSSEREAHAVATPPPLVDPSDEATSGQVGLDTERLLGGNHRAGCPSSSSRAAIRSLLRNCVPSGTSHALAVVGELAGILQPGQEGLREVPVLRETEGVNAGGQFLDAGRR
jgi:hypothetical protein